jgi:hypothetical protein
VLLHPLRVSRLSAATACPHLRNLGAVRGRVCVAYGKQAKNNLPVVKMINPRNQRYRKDVSFETFDPEKNMKRRLVCKSRGNNSKKFDKVRKKPIGAFHLKRGERKPKA